MIHIVLFWLKPDLSLGDRERFAQGVDSLREIPSVRGFSWGPPADTQERPVIDRSYSIGLMVRFDDVAGHDAYQVHELHQAFLAGCSPLWDRVAVYDFDEVATPGT